MQPDLAETVKRSGVVGCSVGILRQGQSAEFVNRGECSIGGDEIANGCLWEAASLTKPVIALLSLAYVLDEPTFLTQKLVADLETVGADDDGRWMHVTPFHLLTHTSGLPNWREDGQPLGFESDPGTAGYSGEGYELLLSELLTRSGLPADSILGRHLTRLGMTHSTFTPEQTTTRSVVVGHDESGGSVPKDHPTKAKASGSLHTTVEDYMRFLQLIARPDDMNTPDLRAVAMLAAERQTEVLPGYGRTLGWAFVAGDDGDVLWQHGDNPGFKHVAAVRPSTGEALLVLTNDDNGQPLYRELCLSFLGIEVW